MSKKKQSKEGGWQYNATGPFRLNYSQPAPPEPPPQPLVGETAHMSPEQLNVIFNDLQLRAMQAGLQLTGSQIQHNNMSVFNMRHQAYLGFLSELRQLVNTYQVDIENTIMMSEPKYKPLFDGVHTESLQDTIMKLVMKLKIDLDIK